ncbi:ABC transporter ATP-binding protein [Spirochaeta dissipatitropha]
MSHPALLEARGLTYSVRNHGRSTDIVSNIDLKIQGGELVGLIGPNGAGKSTLMRLLLGYLKPVSGSILINGQDLHSLKDRQRAAELSYMGQQSPLSFPFSTVEIVEMGAFPVLGLGRVPGKKERSAALEAMSYIGISRLADQNFMTLSGGEQQLALFARCLLQDSSILLLDEPTANLDLGHEAQLLSMARELCTEGKTVLAALHNLNCAAEYCDRLILMADGRIIVAGSPDEVLQGDILQQHYHTPVQIGRNESSGSISVTPASRIERKSHGRVHIIGGAASAVNLTRHLHLLGIPISGGIAHELDSDAKLWKALDVPYIEVPAFSEIDKENLDRAVQLVKEADICILCAFPFGKGNERNLELAASAQHLLILAEPAGSRAFFTHESEKKFRELSADKQCLSYQEAVDTVQRMLI